MFLFVTYTLLTANSCHSVCVCVAASCAGVSKWTQSSVCGEGGDSEQQPAPQRPGSHSTGVCLHNKHILLSVMNTINTDLQQ